MATIVVCGVAFAETQVNSRLVEHEHAIARPFFPQILDALETGPRGRGLFVIRSCGRSQRTTEESTENGSADERRDHTVR